MQCGLLGKTLTHSFSPQIHKELATYRYDLFAIEPEDLHEFFQKADFDGLNVTIPYKQTAINYCNELSDLARKAGSVNTILNQNGKLYGHNSDYFGFSYMLKKSGLTLKGKKVLVLGSGGASATVQLVLKEIGADLIVISRTGSNNYLNIYRHTDAACIINCTPVGMYPNNGESLISLDNFPHLEGVLDLIYNPQKTKLLLDAESMGLIALNGLWMLIAQAKESAELFLGKTIPNAEIDRIYGLLQRNLQNIILIGMPGCGKSTIAAILEKTLNQPMYDTDRCIESVSGCSVPNLFQTQGESAFRSLETKILSDLTKESGIIIATGGGCVTKPENLPLLRQNGIVIWIQRDISLLPINGRPISQKYSAEELYATREPLYRLFAHHTVKNNDDPFNTAQCIIELIKRGILHENSCN